MHDAVILWIVSTTERFELAATRAAERRARLFACSIGGASAAAAAGPVVAIVEDDRAATDAFGAGVDEVIRHSELTADGLDQALDRAVTLARTRLRALASERRGDRPEAFMLLEWIAIELAATFSGGALDGDLLVESVQALVALRKASALSVEGLPSASDMLEAFGSVRESFARVGEVLHAVRALSASDPTGTAMAPLLAALARVLRSRAVPVLDVEVEADPRCVTTVPSPHLVGELVGLVQEVLERASLARSRGTRSRMSLRASVEDEAAVVEVQDDVRDEAPGGETRARWQDRLNGVRKRLLLHGGDVLALATPGRTTVRLVLPLAAGAPAVDGRRLSPGSREN